MVYLSLFAGGVFAGFLLAIALFKKLWPEVRVDIPPPTITDARCQADGTLAIDVTAAGSVENLTLVKLHTRVYDQDPGTVGDPTGATPHDPAPTLTHPLPGGLVGPKDYVVVWAEYHAFSSRVHEYDSCSGSGSGSGRVVRPLTGPAAEQLAAVPREYRVSPAAPPGGSALPPETVLRYATETSTPAEPVWQARGEAGSVREWTLRLLYRDGGFGALLTAVCLVGGKEARLTWVTSDWRFHAPSRLAPESDEPGISALVVQPA